MRANVIDRQGQATGGTIATDDIETAGLRFCDEYGRVQQGRMRSAEVPPAREKHASRVSKRWSSQAVS